MTQLLQALMYFFRKVNDKKSISLDENSFLAQLKHLGVPQEQVEAIASWINHLSDHESHVDLKDYPLQSHQGTRFFTKQECKHLKLKYRCLLSRFQQQGILSSITREMVIDDLMQMPAELITDSRFHWLVLKIVASHGDKMALACIECLMLPKTHHKIH